MQFINDPDVDYFVGETSFKSFDRALREAVLMSLCSPGEDIGVDVLVFSERAAKKIAGDEGKASFRLDPSVFCRFNVQARCVGSVYE